MTESLSSYRHDCKFCDDVLEGSTLDDVQAQGRSHLQEQHREEFQEVFVDKVSGRPCLNGCGYSFPSEAEDGTGFECPNCEYDHFAEIADRHIWWRVEAE